MKSLIAAIAALAPLLATGAFAQSVSEDVNKQLWCGTAFIVYFDGQDLSPEMEPIFDAATAALEEVTQAHLDAGFTEEQVTQIRTDMVATVTKEFEEGTAQYEPEDCLDFLGVAMPGEEAPAVEPSAEAAQ